jgi:CubicO group peptidase (beta-lactamase class C family)
VYPRDATRLESPDLAVPLSVRRSAGYAGGIVSAALDGMRVARAIIAPGSLAPE